MPAWPWPTQPCHQNPLPQEGTVAPRPAWCSASLLHQRMPATGQVCTDMEDQYEALSHGGGTMTELLSHLNLLSTQAG